MTDAAADVRPNRWNCTGGGCTSQDPILVVKERPPPLYVGARTFAACGRVEVEIEYYNSWTKGLQKLQGRVSYARKAKSMNAALSQIQRESDHVEDVGFWCESENTLQAAITTVAKEGGSARWILTIDERLEVDVAGPEAIPEEIVP